MSLLFELEQHQKLVVYEEGNQILAVPSSASTWWRIPYEGGMPLGSYRVVYKENIRLAWQITGASYYSVRNG